MLHESYFKLGAIRCPEVANKPIAVQMSTNGFKRPFRCCM